MNRKVARVAGAFAIVAVLAGVGASGALAQDYPGTRVTFGGEIAGVEIGHVFDLAPGVTIDAGDVSNETGIGVITIGGSSIGSVPGGGTNASIVE